MLTKDGAVKIASKKIGITVEEYVAHRNNGEKWCFHCDTWKPSGAFHKDSSRGDGLKAKCRDCSYQPNGKVVFPSFKGRSHTPEAREKMSKARKGNKNRLGKPFTHEQLAYLRQRTIETTLRGANNANWRGGVTPENERLRHSPHYADWRNAVFTRDGYSCQKCGNSKGGNLNAHHVLSWSQYPEYRFDVNNGLTLCETCHAQVHHKPDSIRRQMNARKEAAHE